MLYVCTVFATVYRCRREGQLLHPEEIKRDPRRGDLRVSRRGMRRIAVLLAPDGERYIVPLLDRVRLLAVDGRGVLLTGLERIPPRGLKGSGLAFMQTWWCELHSHVP